MEPKTHTCKHLCCGCSNILQQNFHANQTHFHGKRFARGLHFELPFTSMSSPRLKKRRPFVTCPHVV